MDVSVILDARRHIDDLLIAFEPVLGEPLILHSLNIIKKANRISETVVLIPKGKEGEFIDFFKNYPEFKDIELSQEDVLSQNAVTISIDQIFVPHILKGILKSRRANISNALIMQISRKEDIEKAEAFLIRDRDLVISRYANMRIARRMVFYLLDKKVTPNQISLLMGLFGVGSAVLAAIGGYRYDLLSVLCMQIALTLDLTDGYLARLRGCSSQFGSWFDTLLDEIVTISIITGIVIGVIRSSPGVVWYFLGAVWILSYHALACSFWFNKALDLNEPISDSSPDQAAQRVFTKVKKVRILGGVKWAINATGGLDTKFYIMSVGMILNIKGLLIAFMAISQASILLNVILTRYLGAKTE